jgi:hypothetical protein
MVEANSLSYNKNIHKRDLSLYKPSIDGSWLANERSILLKLAMQKTSKTTSTMITTTSSKYISQKLNVNELSISLINIFKKLIFQLEKNMHN